MNNYDTTKYPSLKYYNANTQKAFRGLLKSLKSNGLEIFKVTNHEEDIDVSKDTPVLEIMEHCFSCESYAIYVRTEAEYKGYLTKWEDSIGNPARHPLNSKIYGHLDGCVEGMILDWTNSTHYVGQKVEKAMDDFNDKYEDLDLS